MKRHPARILVPALLVLLAGCTSLTSVNTKGEMGKAIAEALNDTQRMESDDPLVDLTWEMMLYERFKLVPERYGEASFKNLKSYYAYKEVRRWLLDCPTSEPTKCVAFLFAYLPPVDYGALTPELLREHVEYALKVRAEAPWRAQFTDELFYHYILPHRVSQEPCQAWRKLMHDELWPRVKDLPMQEAALEANRYAREYATFQPTNSRDQGPLTTMLRGVGRCEEEMILYICAARSIGIPARPCHTPYWTYTDNNHAWCEAYADGRWWFLGGCEPELELDRGWFAGPASRAGLVVSTAYGDVVDSKEPVYRRATGVTFINSTPVYGDTCEVSILADAAISSEVYVHVFNFGSLRPMARVAAGNTIVLGRGDFVLTAQTKDGPVAALARTWDDKAAAPDVLAKAQVKLTPDGWKQYVLGMPSPSAGDEPGPVDVHHWLRYPNAPRRGKGRAGATAQKQLTLEQKQSLRDASNTRQKARDQWRAERSKLTPEDEKLIAALPGDYPERARKQLARCGANTPEIMSAIRLTLRLWDPWAVDVLELGDEKDCFEWRATTLSESVMRAREWKNLWDDPTWRSFILNHRVQNESNYILEQFLLPPPKGVVEAELPENAALRGLPLFKRKAILNDRWAKLLGKPCERTSFGHIPGVGEVYRARRATKQNAAVAFAKELRWWGIPTRMAASGEWVEVLQDGSWQPCYPFEPENSGKVKREAEAAYAQPGRLTVSFMRDGGEYPDAQAWRDFMLCRVDKGFVEPLEDLEWKENACEVAPGDYVLFTGARSGRGDVCFRSVRVHVESRQTTRIVADCTLVREELDAVELASRKLDSWPEAKVSGADSKLVTLQEIVGDKPTLVILLNTNDEPARRLLALLAPMQDEFKARGINVAAIYVGKEGREDWEKRATEAGVSITLYDDPEQTLFQEIGATEQPAVLLLTQGGETLLWHEGYALHMPQLIKGAMRWVK
ncbi:MAG: redoxin domain-containing protein [Planctomycetes bacterium]|nr:redoxin domain-containing protein [Planctomycetota bacterium]